MTQLQESSQSVKLQETHSNINKKKSTPPPHQNDLMTKTCRDREKNTMEPAQIA